MKGIKVYQRPNRPAQVTAFLENLEPKFRDKLVLQLYRLSQTPRAELREPHYKHFSIERYQGTLTLDHTTIRTEAAGYTTKSYTVTAAKTIGPVDRNDMSYVPATTVKDGRTLNLSNVEWQVTGTELVGGVLMPSSYQAVATYSGAASYSAATGYVTTADYVGEVSRDGVESVTYQLTYLGEADASAGSEDGPWLLSVLSTRWPYILGGVGSAVLLILVTLLLRSRREIRRLRSEQESMLPEDNDEEEESERETDSTIS